jgi:hypothetical protein
MLVKAGPESRARGRARPARRKADPSQPPFASFLERDALRQGREKGRRRTVAISLGVHLLAFAALLAYSLFQVEELWGPSVEVKMFSPAKLPPGVARPRPVAR